MKTTKEVTAFGIYLIPDQAADQSYLHPLKTVNLKMELQFATLLAKTINVLVYAEFDNLIEINGLREVTTDTKDECRILH